MEKRKPSFTVSMNVNWYKHYREPYGGLIFGKTNTIM